SRGGGREGGLAGRRGSGSHRRTGGRGRWGAQPSVASAEGRRGVAIQGDALPEILLPTNCPGCGIGLETDELRSHNYVCVNCGHHFRLGADVWIQLVADKGSWHERWTDVRSHDLLNWTVPKPYQETVERLLEDGLNEALRTGTCTLAAKTVCLATFGGTAASRVLRGDINNAEPGAAIGFTGPRVIKQATYADLPPGFQSAEFQLAHGQVDMVVPRTELRPLLAHLLEMYSSAYGRWSR